MKVTLASDLHTEFGAITLPNTGDSTVCILAGDIMVAGEIDRRCNQELMAQVCGDYPHVVVIAGNHEFYGSEWSAAIDRLREAWGRWSNAHFLHRETAVINGFKFIGDTLWTDLRGGDPLVKLAAARGMNDYRRIRVGDRLLRPDDTVLEHQLGVKYITEQLEDGVPTVVVAHHPPSSLSVHPNYHNSGSINWAFHSQLEEVIDAAIGVPLWVCGHTHHPHQYRIGNTLVAANPRGYCGYESQAASFQPRILDLHNLPQPHAVEWL